MRTADGNITAFDPPGTSPTSGSRADGINNEGTVVGSFIDANFASHGYVRAADGTFTIVDLPSESGVIALVSINAVGTSTGYFTNNPHGLVRALDGTITTFDVPGAGTGGCGTGPASVNDAGTITGSFLDGVNCVMHGFVRAPDGTITIFNAPGASTQPSQGTNSRSINAAGAITGYFMDSSGFLHGFLLPGAPLVSSFIPSSGPVGTTVTLTGANFAGTTAVSFNGTAVGQFNVVSDTQLSAAVPNGAASGPITVTNQAGGGSSTTSFRVVPRILSFTPTSGTIGMPVMITGTSFTGATAVTFFRVPTTFIVNSDTQITATVPGGATTGWISVKSPAGTGYSHTNFAVTSAAVPTIISFSPGSGSVDWTVTLTGTNFTGTTGVSFSGTPATNIWAVSDTQFKAKVPSGATSGPITLTNTVGSATSAASFTVKPQISSFTPASGTMGTTVTITGNGFNGATAVTFFRVPTNFTVVSDTQITATVPGGALSGWISVKAPNGTLWSSNNFTATSASPPTISSFSPASGSASWTITLTGTNFTGTTGVSINGVAATTFWTTSDSQLKVTVPSGATSGPITVTNTAGTASSTSNLTVN